MVTCKQLKDDGFDFVGGGPFTSVLIAIPSYAGAKAITMYHASELTDEYHRGPEEDHYKLFVRR